MTIEEAKKLLPVELKYPLPDGVIDNLINVQAIPLQFDFSNEDGNDNKGMNYAMMAALIELKEHREKKKCLTNIKDTVEYKKGYKDGWNSCINDSADGWMVDYI